MSRAFNACVKQICDKRRPQTIYLAIGCANSAIQQFPPFLASSRNTSQLCIWVDPCLEDVPEGLALTELSPVPLSECEVLEGPHTQCVVLRKHFYWKAGDSSIWTDFMNMLYTYTAKNPTSPQLIVQDYSGVNFARFYSSQIQAYDRCHFLSHVLFDVTYNEGGCYVDFDKVCILRYPGSGAFFQPAYETLGSIHQWVKKGGTNGSEHLQCELDKRMRYMKHSIYRLYRTLEGREEARDFYSPDSVCTRCSHLFVMYNLPPAVTELCVVRRLLIAFFHDLASIVEYTQSEEETQTLLDGPDNAEFLHAIDLLHLMVS